MTIEPDHLYLLPPALTVKVDGGYLRTNKLDIPVGGLDVTITTLFTSLGAYFQSRAVGILMSGTGSDGVEGVRSIKEHNGMIMVQNNPDKYVLPLIYLT